jgi:crossover junction endodeoxyribonuclease RuvC
MALVIGIDLGLTGAMALIDHHGLLDMRDLPVMPRSSAGSVKNQVNAAGLREVLREWMQGHDKNEAMCFWERVSAMPSQGSASTFSLGHTAGIVEGVVCAVGLAHMLIAPASWKKHFKLPKEKDAARALAQRYYPEASLGRIKDHNRAEAILIARYGWETWA